MTKEREMSEIYTEERMRKLFACGVYRPGWMSLPHNEIIERIFQKANLIRNDFCLLINFSKKTQSYFNIKGICIAVTENEEQKEQVQEIWNKDNELFDAVMTADEFSEWKWIDPMKKFDKIIMNPPYNGNSNLYGKITLEAKKHAKEVVCLSPYLNYLSNAQKKGVKEVANELLPHLKSYELLINDGKLFDACFDKELCIFHFVDDPKTTVDINEIYWKQFTNPDLTKSIIEKIKAYGSYCYDKIIPKKRFDDYKYKVAFTGTRGHCIDGKKLWDWTTILDEDKMTNFNIKTNEGTMDMYGVPFETENECKEFVKWANSDIFGYLILVQKHSIGMDKWLFKSIPYFDFTKKWDDVKRCKELKLTKEEYNYIVEEMKDFGWKVKTKENNNEIKNI